MKTSLENDIFWSEIGQGFGKRGGTPAPTKNTKEYSGMNLKTPIKI